MKDGQPLRKREMNYILKKKTESFRTFFDGDILVNTIGVKKIKVRLEMCYASPGALQYSTTPNLLVYHQLQRSIMSKYIAQNEYGLIRFIISYKNHWII